jgi:hypothetical protein
MKRMIKAIFRKVFGPLFFVLAMSVPSYAQVAPVLWAFDFDSATETFAALDPVLKQGTVAVSASASTTLTGTNAFTNVARGDYLLIKSGTTQYEVSVVARASASSITISGPAITVTNATFQYRTLITSTDVNSDQGSFRVGSINRGLASFNLTQQVATGGVDIRLVCRPHPSSKFVQVWPVQTDTTAAAAYINYTTGTAAQKAIPITEPYYSCKFGFKVGSADDGDDLTTNTESMYLFFAKN